MVELLGFASRWWQCGGVIQVSAFQLQLLWSFWCSYCRSSLLQLSLSLSFSNSSSATLIRSGLGQGDKSFGRNLVRHVSAYAFSAQFRSSVSDDRIFRLATLKTKHYGQRSFSSPCTRNRIPHRIILLPHSFSNLFWNLISSTYLGKNSFTVIWFIKKTKKLQV